ncbi:MAG TPA: glycosyltransferase family 2 protein [Candidatus Dormibacteraeota bacterium]
MVLVNYNGHGRLQACLEALRPQAVDAGAEVVVVDNASTDYSLQWLREQRGWLRLIASSVNLGFAAANNLAIRESKAPFLILLNTDTRPRPGALGALLAAAESSPRAAAVTAKLVFADRPSVIQNAGLLLLSDGSGGDRGTGEEDRGQFDRAEEVFGACGAAMLLRRMALTEAGLFDQTFWMYYEDLDLSWRLRLAGWRVLYEPGAVVEHEHAGTSGEWSSRFTFLVDRNRLFTVLKNGAPALVARSFSSLLGRATRSAASADPAPNRGPRRARAHGPVALSFARHLPEMLAKRRLIRSRRQVSDAEIEGWMFPRARWDAR